MNLGWKGRSDTDLCLRVTVIYLQLCLKVFLVQERSDSSMDQLGSKRDLPTINVRIQFILQAPSLQRSSTPCMHLSQGHP